MPAPTDRDKFDFVMQFIRHSERFKDQFVPVWKEVTENFMVQPWSRKQATTPEDPYRQGRPYRSSRSGIVLKDAETHKAIMTYAAKLVKSAVGDPNREYVKAKPRGWEDAPDSAPTVTRLLRYDFGLPGVFRTLVEAVVDMLLFGTSIVEVVWKYQEREQPVREVFEQFGVETSTESRMRVPSYDDVCLNVLDVMDFYPDPGEYRIENMPGAAKGFKMTAAKARAMAAGGVYDKDAVERAIESAGKSMERKSDPSNFREGRDQPHDRVAMTDFMEMTGYEYWGEVPWVEDASSRQVVTVLQDQVVRSDPWPLADSELPWKTMIINPVQGRFYGVAPGEVIRYDQDFTDALKMLLAEAIVRNVHPPIAYDSDGDIDLAKLMRWKADLPVGIRGGPKSVGTLNYNADVGAGFGLMQGLKTGMQETTGAVGGLQGINGPDREAASVGVLRHQNAMDRPELGAMLIENESLPAIARAMLRRNQQFVVDTADLKRRIGDMPEPAWIGDIMGDYDVEFVGSRMAMSRQERLQMSDRLISLAAALPQVAAMVPWEQFLTRMIGRDMELPDVAAMIANPEMMKQNVILQMLTGAGATGNGNGVTQTKEPPGLMPAQAAGNTVA